MKYLLLLCPSLLFAQLHIDSYSCSLRMRPGETVNVKYEWEGDDTLVIFPQKANPENYFRALTLIQVPPHCWSVVTVQCLRQSDTSVSGYFFLATSDRIRPIITITIHGIAVPAGVSERQENYQSSRLSEYDLLGRRIKHKQTSGPYFERGRKDLFVK